MAKRKKAAAKKKGKAKGKAGATLTQCADCCRTLENRVAAIEKHLNFPVVASQMPPEA